ncbi:MAG: hypothetical protein QM765_25145 [Myxococcales bacterium]
MDASEQQEKLCTCQGCRRPAVVESTGMCAFCDDHAFHAHCKECGAPVIERGAGADGALCKLCRTQPLK